MYQNKLVATIKANGKFLREFKDTVYIPFFTEYEICLKNLNTVRAIVNVFIDGDNAIPGGLVLQAGQEINLERSVKNGNLNEGNRFKFIERTGAIESHRGVKLEDGIVRIEFQFEKVPQYDPGWKTYDDSRSVPVWGSPSWGTGIHYKGISGSSGYIVNGVARSVDFSNGEAVRNSAATAINQYCIDHNITSKSDWHNGMATMACSYNDAGITVPGSKSDQKFSTAKWFPTESETHTIVLKLLGETPDNKPIVKPVTVKHKPECKICGKLNKATNKFCSECGASLVIY